MSLIVRMRPWGTIEAWSWGLCTVACVSVLVCSTGLRMMWCTLVIWSLRADSKSVLTACDDMQSFMFDVANGELVQAFSGHESWVLSVSCHPDGTAFATGSSDSKIK